jgi:hypothetical protein
VARGDDSSEEVQSLNHAMKLGASSACSDLYGFAISVETLLEK